MATQSAPRAHLYSSHWFDMGGSLCEGSVSRSFPGFLQKTSDDMSTKSHTRIQAKLTLIWFFNCSVSTRNCSNSLLMANFVEYKKQKIKSAKRRRKQTVIFFYFFLQFEITQLRGNMELVVGQTRIEWVLHTESPRSLHLCAPGIRRHQLRLPPRKRNVCMSRVECMSSSNLYQEVTSSITLHLHHIYIFLFLLLSIKTCFKIGKRSLEGE